MKAKIVSKMRDLQCWMSAITLGHAPDKLSGFATKVNAIGAIVLPRPVTETLAVACYRQHVRIKTTHPCWWRGCSSGKVSRNTMLGKHIHDVIQLIKLVMTWPGF